MNSVNDTLSKKEQMKILKKTEYLRQCSHEIFVDIEGDSENFSEIEEEECADCLNLSFIVTMISVKPTKQYPSRK